MIEAAGWCSERDRRWASYHAHAEAFPWPQSFVFLKPELGLMACLRGGGGGAQQATFRGTLETILTDACERWATEAGEAESDWLRRLRRTKFDPQSPPPSPPE